MKTKLLKVLAAVVGLSLLLSVAPAYGMQTETATVAEPTLLLYSTVGRMLGGDMSNAVTPATIENDLQAFPPGWAVVGVGTTNQPGRSGELMPDGTAGDLHYWWADPASASHAAVIDLGSYLIPLPTPAPNATAEAVISMPIDFNPEFPFMALAIADPATAITLHAQAVDDVYAWLRTAIADEGILLAGIQVTGQFGEVKTSISYNIPRTGLDLSEGYVGEDHFYFGDYPSGQWVMNGLYAASPDIQPMIATGTNTVHLHGYMPDTLLGGHITAAAATDITVTLYPIQTIDRELDAPAPGGS